MATTTAHLPAPRSHPSATVPEPSSPASSRRGCRPRRASWGWSPTVAQSLDALGAAAEPGSTHRPGQGHRFGRGGRRRCPRRRSGQRRPRPPGRWSPASRLACGPARVRPRRYRRTRPGGGSGSRTTRSPRRRPSARSIRTPGEERGALLHRQAAGVAAPGTAPPAAAGRRADPCRPIRRHSSCGGGRHGRRR